MPSKDRGRSDDKKSAKGPAATGGTAQKGAPAPKGKYAAEAPKMEGKQKKAKLHKDKRGRGAK